MLESYTLQGRDVGKTTQMTKQYRFVQELSGHYATNLDASSVLPHA